MLDRGKVCILHFYGAKVILNPTYQCKQLGHVVYE